jgi:transglutaminase-like putative cysteine protease
VNLALHYVTSYAYTGPVTDNLNALRVRPATTAHQRVDEFHLRISPETRVHRYTDYFGTEVVEFGIAGAHESLTVDVRARVLTTEPPDPPETPWEALRDPGYQEVAGEFLDPTGPEPEGPLMDELIEVSRAKTPLATVRWLNDLIPDRFEYRPGVTYVGSTVDDLLEAGAGVCQDFVHLALVLLRRQGIAARYVSGYLWNAPPDGGLDSVEVQTHAWLEALLPGTGDTARPVWVGADPTNRRLAGETHVKVGHGRFYADVPPIKGVYRGTATAALQANVQMTRIDAPAAARD